MKEFIKKYKYNPLILFLIITFLLPFLSLWLQIWINHYSAKFVLYGIEAASPTIAVIMILYITDSINSIYKRRSIRKFQEKDLPIELLNKILDAGRVAPSAKNRQPWNYIVFENKYKEELLQVMEDGLQREEKGITDLPKSQYGILDAKNTLRIMKEAPIIIVVINSNAKSPFLPVDNDERVAEICDSLSIGASIENLLLAAEELGLGTLWIADICFAYKELAAYLNTEEQLVGAIAIGYANERPEQRPRKPLNKIVKYRL